MIDLTKNHPFKTILLFSIPLLIGNIFQQIYSLSDTIIVGKTLGVDALAAVGFTGSISFLIIGFAQGLTIGMSLLIAKFYGAKQYDRVKTSFAASIIISFIASVLLMALSFTFLDDMMKWMNTPVEIEQSAKIYLSTIFAGLPFILLFNLFSNVIRALGDSKTPLFFLAISCIANVVLALIFICIFNMGIFGAGLATFIAYIIPVIQCIYLIKKNMPMLVINKDSFENIILSDFSNHLKMALPMGFQMSIIGIGVIVLQTTLNSLGTDVVAAQSIANKVDQLAIQPLNSIGIAMATFTAQNYGAKLYQRIIVGVKQTLIASITFGIFAGLLIIFLGKIIILGFVSPEETAVIELTQTYFLITESGYFILATLFVLRNTLQGLGYGITTTAAGIAELVMRSFAAIVLVQYIGFAGACLASPLAWLGSTLILIIRYKSAKSLLKDETYDIYFDINTYNSNDLVAAY
ncbi:MATE family efflux transporter [Mycoplasma sp. P36-A1]|uniref:MATE family efflux transporter n=1 Tax=Mycoplasma sp. P36-A1 TaxID=3252900 RepID=UPI003C2B0E11